MAKDWEKIRARAKELGTDGCTGVADFRIDCCYEHDIAYFTGHDVDGNPISKKQADKNFRKCIQEHSFFGVLSPMSWVRWAGVSLFGRGYWSKEK